jgi:hypothetical protein
MAVANRAYRLEKWKSGEETGFMGLAGKRPRMFDRVELLIGSITTNKKILMFAVLPYLVY